MRKKYCLTAALALMASCGGAWADDGKVITGRYWFDQGKQYPFTPGTFEIDTKNLQEGIHTLNVYAESDGILSSVASRWFVKAPMIAENSTYTAITYVDGKPFTTTSAISSGNLVNLQLDCSTLPMGVHPISVQLVTPNGVPTSFRESFFYRMPTNSELSTLHAYYMLDDRQIGDIDISKSGNLCHLDIDMSTLPSGIHSVSVFLASPYGFATSPQTSWFIKIPIGGEGVTAYEYWLNDNYEKTQKVVLDKVANPFSILSLIDVAEEPLCSSRYTFSIEDDKPVIYAKNDFQVRFMDGDGRMTSASGSYTDVRVREAVTDIDSLIRGERNEIDELPENTIKWYTFDGEIGDSINVMLSCGAMMEIYTPSAETIIATRGAQSLDGVSCVLKENGKYYVAVHDAPSYNTRYVGVTFNHVHKFDMIENTPTYGSAGGDLFMDIVGNGFETLASISLVKDDVRIPAKDKVVRDNYNLTVQFDLKNSEIPLGNYSIEAVFANTEKNSRETIVRENAFSMQESQPVEIEVAIKPSGLPATPYEVTVEITNKSNTACWGVPLNIAFKGIESGFDLSFKNFYFEGDSTFVWTDNLIGTEQEGYFCPAILPYLGPGETLNLTIGIRSNPMEMMRMYAWSGQPWSEGIKEIRNKTFDFKRLLEKYNSNLVTIEAICNMYAKYRNLTNLKDIEAQCDKILSVLEKLASDRYAAMKLHGLFESSDEHGANLGTAIQKYGDYLDRIKPCIPTVQSLVNEAMMAFAFSIPVTPGILESPIPPICYGPIPMPDPTDFPTYQSGDPNDMRGYESPAGTNYIGHKVKTVEYTIEFENDPEIANASAMKVNVENEINANSFDLNSFVPRIMQIGNKEVELPNSHKFSKTIDMRPEINTIANLDFEYDAKTGKARWDIRSFDPLTMEESKYMNDGLLPVNDSTGRGQGYLVYSIDLLDGLPDGAEIKNHAVITFDNNDPIETPVWTNITDYSLPTSTIEEVKTDDDLTYRFKVSGEDIGAGIWHYDLFIKPKEGGEWTPVLVQIENDEFSYTSQESLKDYQFMIVATDRAGNRQDDVIRNILMGDADGNGVVDSNDVVVIRNYYLETTQAINKAASDVNNDGVIDAQDALTTRIIYLDTTILSKRKQARKH